MKQQATFEAVKITLISTIGSAILVAPNTFAKLVSSPYIGLFVLCAAGVLTLLQSLCYAELARMFPTGGGDAKYMQEAFMNEIGIFYNFFSCCAILPASAAFCMSRMLSAAGWTSSWIVYAAVMTTLIIFVVPESVKNFVFQVFFYLKMFCLALLALMVCISFSGTCSGWLHGDSVKSWSIDGMVVAFVNCTYFFSGYNTCNYIGSSGPLSHAYAISTIITTAVYLFFTASQFYIFSKDELVENSMLSKLVSTSIGAWIPADALGTISTLVRALIEISMYLGPLLGCHAVYDGIIKSNPIFQKRRYADIIHFLSYIVYGFLISTIIITNTSLTILNGTSILISLFYCLTFIGLLKLRNRVSDPISIFIPLISVVISAGVVGFNVYQKFFK